MVTIIEPIRGAVLTLRKVFFRLGAAVALFVCVGFLQGAPVQAAPRDLVSPSGMPMTDRAGAEKQFFLAYDAFMENRLWRALDHLSQSRRLNTYFVDTYYLQSLIERRLGRYPQAIAAMKSYAEVRRNDVRALRIVDSLGDESRELRSAFFPVSADYDYGFRSLKLPEIFPLELWDRPAFWGFKGLGKISAVGNLIYCPDTYGNVLYAFDEHAGGRFAYKLPVASPLVVAPLDPTRALLFLSDGNVFELAVDSAARTLALGKGTKLPFVPADACMLSSSLLAVADRNDKKIRLLAYPDFRELKSWSPAASGERNKFEPVAVAAYGTMLAHADRGNGRVVVLDFETFEQLDAFELADARDVEWGKQGELYALQESGATSRRFPVDAATGATETILSSAQNSWSLCARKNTLVVAAINGRTWWMGTFAPTQAVHVGTLNLFSPKIVSADGTETLSLRGRSGSRYTMDRVVSSRGIAGSAVWRQELLACAVEQAAVSASEHALAAGPDEELLRAVDMDSLWRTLARYSSSGKPLPSVLALDSRISATAGQLAELFAFAMNQCLRIDVFQNSSPASFEMLRLAGFSGGNVYNAPVPKGIPFYGSVEWEIAIPLPREPIPYGYPSDATLSVFIDMQNIRFRDWLPIWPSLVRNGGLKQGDTPEGASKKF